MRKTVILGIVSLLTFMLGCSKQDKQDKVESLFENKNMAELRSKPFNPVLNDYTTQILKIGFDHGLLSTLRKDEKFKGINKQYDLDVANIQKHSYAHTPIEIIFIPIKTNKDKSVLAVYSANNKYVFIIGNEVELGNGFRHISYSTPDKPGSIYYEFQLSPQNTIGKFRSHNELSISGLIVPESVSIPNPIDKEIIGYKAPVAGCCSLGFNSCMNCFVNSCGEDWTCIIGCGALNLWCAAAWGTACITKSGCSRSF